MMQSAEDVESTEETSSHHRPGHDVPSQAPPSRSPAAATAAARALSNADNPLLLAKMLDLASITRISWLCRTTRESFGRKAHKLCLTHGAGVPEDRRVEFWMCVLNVKKVRVPESYVPWLLLLLWYVAPLVINVSFRFLPSPI